MSDYGKRTITILEVDQPRCLKEYGTTNAAGDCDAVLGITGQHKCHNAQVTCQDLPNYLPETQTIRYSHPQRGLSQFYDNIIPSIAEEVDNPRTTPGAINLAGMDRSLSALGAREVVEIIFNDHQWNDHLHDKYRLERISGAAQVDAAGYDPKTRGTYWGKWQARNPYSSNYRARLKQGFMGQPLAEMKTRSYIVDRVEGPTSGRVRMVLKDLFSLIEAKKAVAPVASRGELNADITGSPATFTLAPAGIGNAEYPASGYVAIGDEAIAFTRSGDVMTITQRGALNTVAEDHDEEDLVQLVLSLSAAQAHEHIYTLLTGYTGVLPAEIPKTIWDVLAEPMTELYSTRITTPTPVERLIAELTEQSGCTAWPNPESGLIEFEPLRPKAASITVDDRSWIVQRSIAVRPQNDKRVSRVLVYIGQVNPMIRLDDRRNFSNRVISLDLASEGPTQHGTPANKEIFSRWIPQFGRQVAEATGGRIISLFRNPPLEAVFRLHASRDGALRLAQPFTLQTFGVQDVTGLESSEVMTPVEISRDENQMSVRAQGTKFFIAPDDTSVRTIYLDSNALNLNLREVHDLNYVAPTGDEVIKFILVEGFLIGSASATVPAITTGSWPTMATPPSITIDGRVEGKGGKGGNANGGNGQVGGTAFKAEVAFEVDNLNGEMWGGGGAGGAGGAIASSVGIVGGGGGGGAGKDPGAGGSGYAGGSAGTTEAGGAGGAGWPGIGGAGGAGGGPGLAGSAGIGTVSPPGAGGAAGKYAEGDSLITWINTGDRRGNVS